MADWSLPTLTSLYTDFLTFMSARLNDCATLFSSAPSNQPIGTIRFNRSAGTGKFQEWDGATWNDVTITLAGGGTGVATAVLARTALGLGTMAVQDNNTVNITGGTIAGAALSASDLTSGLVAQTRLGSGSGGAGAKVLLDNQTWGLPTSDFTFGNPDDISGVGLAFSSVLQNRCMIFGKYVQVHLSFKFPSNISAAAVQIDLHSYAAIPAMKNAFACATIGYTDQGTGDILALVSGATKVIQFYNSGGAQYANSAFSLKTIDLSFNYIST